MGEHAQGTRVGPGVRMPRLPALYKQETRWRIPEQGRPTGLSGVFTGSRCDMEAQLFFTGPVEG